MEFRHIYYFIKVTEYGNITKAAQALFLSQQALSKSLKNLENELQVSLIHRTSHGIELTEDGQFLRDQFQDICASYDSAVKTSYNHFHIRNEQVEFAVCNGFFRSISVDHLIHFSELYPNLELEQVEGTDLSCEEYVRENKHHFALSTKPWKTEDLQYKPLHREQLFFIAHKDHPLAGKESIHMSELSHEKFLFFNKKYNLHFRTLEGCRKHGFQPEIIYKSSDVSQLVKLASKNQGILICVKHVYEESSHENLVCIPILDEDMYWELGLIYQDFKYLNKNQNLFINYILQEYSSELFHS